MCSSDLSFSIEKTPGFDVKKTCVHQDPYFCGIAKVNKSAARIMKKAIGVTALIAVVGLIGLYVYGRPAYRHYKEARSMEQASRFFAKRDYRNASLSARQTLQINPRNIEACRIMAELAEISRSPHALDWRRRVAELAPTIENRMKVASSALRSQAAPYPLAKQVLEELEASANDRAAYHVICAELAMKTKNMEVAAGEFEKASRLEPTNELHQLNMAALRLQSRNADVATEARATLERLRASADVGAAALRWLVTDSLMKNEWAIADEYSKQLLADPQVTLDDRLQRLGILQQTKDPAFDASLATVRKDVSTNATPIYAVSSWMIAHGLADDAGQWLTNFPAKVRAEQPVPLAMVEWYMAKKDWEGLETFLQTTKWSDREFLRFAFLSRAASEQKQEMAAASRWRTAVREAGDRLGPLTFLLQMAGNPGQNQAREDLLWRIAQRFPRERWALGELDRIYVAAGNTLGLNKIYSTMASYDPKDFCVRNNLAATSMLLKLNLSTAHDMAKELYKQHPDEAIITSTYAYSLDLQGRTREGLAVLEKLKPASLESPPVALYYGVLLSSISETNKATKYLAIAQRGTLLPEEQELLASALKPL